MTIAFGDEVRAAVSMVYRGVDIFQNVYHYEAGVGVDATEESVKSALRVHLLSAYNNLNAQVAEELVGLQIDFWKRNTGTAKWDAIGVKDFSTWLPSNASDELPSGVAAVVRFFTSGIGRQGRKFIAGLADTAFVDGALVAAAITAISNYADEIVEAVAVTGGDMDPGWWSEIDTLIYEMDGSYVINAIPGYQRRRKQGVGS